jgi:hypothetical protein
MKTIKMKVELAYDEGYFGDSKEEHEFFKWALTHRKNILFNQEIGDEVGEIKVVKMGDI